MSEAGAIIVGKSAHGVFNATQTFLQLLPAFVYCGTEVVADWGAPATGIVDEPRYANRAIMLDVARSFLGWTRSRTPSTARRP